MSNHEFIYDDETIASTCDKTADGVTVTVGEQKFTFVPVGDDCFRTMVNGKSLVVAAVQSEDTVYVDIDSRLIDIAEPSEDGFAGGGAAGAGEKDKIFAPMPGKVVKIQVEMGQEVEEKTPMVIVEAMKMENQVNSRAKGTVKAINFAAGDQVDTETPIIELELDES